MKSWYLVFTCKTYGVLQAKGLQKLRWYCQVCQKQCRDENGFKCHLTSESHRRQMACVAENPDRFMDEYSTEVSSVSFLVPCIYSHKPFLIII